MQKKDDEEVEECEDRNEREKRKEVKEKVIRKRTLKKYDKKL